MASEVQAYLSLSKLRDSEVIHAAPIHHNCFSDVKELLERKAVRFYPVFCLYAREVHLNPLRRFCLCPNKSGQFYIS